MTPRDVLQLWRERWGKGIDGLPDRPYERGAVYVWLQKFAQSSVWNVSLSSQLIAVISALTLMLAVKIEFAMNGQITFAGLLIAFVFFARRYSGSLFSLMIVYLTIIACIQYFHWRFTQTIVIRTTVEMFMSLGLCAVEMCLAAYLFIKAINRFWPILVELVPSFKSDSALPAVTLIVNVTGLKETQALEYLERCKTLDWPLRQLQLRVVAGEPNSRLKEFCAANAIDLLSNATPAVDNAITSSVGEFVLLLDAQPDCELPLNAVRRLIGWFEEQPGLALVYSKGKCPVSSCTSIELSFVVLRKSKYLSLNGSQSEALYKKLDRLRMHSGLVVQRVTTGAWLRVDRADSPWLLDCKRRLIAFEAMLLFYKPFAVACLLLWPLLTLLADFSLVTVANGKAQSLALFAIPYGVMLIVLHERLEPLRRWGMFKIVQEMLLAGYISVRTAWAFTRASWLDRSLFLRRSFGLSLGWFALAKSALVYSLVVLSAISILVGVASLPGLYAKSLAAEHFDVFTAQLIYMTLSAANIAMLLSRMAVLHESNHIEWFVREKRKIAVTVVLSSGRTIACSTVNFPQTSLCLKLPERIDDFLANDLSGILLLQFRHGLLPFNVTVHTSGIEGDRLFVETSEASLTVYSELKDFVMSRGNDWPTWFPEKNADQILPLWITERMAALPAKGIDVLVKVTNVLNIKALVELIRR